METRESRKLVVIVHADVVGSTLLVQQNETEAHARIQDVFKRFSTTIAAYGGETRELRGDALLAEFSRASDAVCAALAFQVENSHEIEPLAGGMHPQLRVGIALGEVVIADNTVTGAGVVLAQRLEQLADSGGVCIQGAAYETVPQRLPVLFEGMGEQTVKGFSEPVRVFRASIRPDAEVPAPESPARHGKGKGNKKRTRLIAVIAVSLLVVAGFAVWLSPKFEKSTSLQEILPAIPDNRPSIAVLPFDNLGGDPGQDYFADGLADDLITDLSKIPGLFVTARNSSFAYRDDTNDIREIAARLGVRYLLDGSVRRADAQVRINVQLIDVDSGEYIWSERFDRKLSNIFELQDEVTRKIVNALEVSLDASRSVKDRPANFAAYDMLLRALEVQSRFTPVDNAGGRVLFQRAAELDPGYARAYAGVALTHAIDVNMNWTADREKSIRLGFEAVNQALEIDTDLPRANFAQGSLLLAERRHEEAENVMRHAVQLAPNYADGFAQLSFVQALSGKHEQALEAIHAAKRLNPHYSQLYMYVESIALFHLDRFEQAATILETAVERNPAFDRVQLLLAAAYGYLGNKEEAAWALQEVEILLPGLSLEGERMDTVLLKNADLERYLKGLELAGLTE